MVAGSGTLTSPPPLAVGGTDNMTATAGLPANPQGTDGTGEVGPTRTTSRTGENRRSNKPIMEKRRRARINNCLNELKTLILDAMKKDPARHSKLEKADILEMTVKHLETLQRQQVAMAAATDPSVANKFRAGFTECAGEVGRFPGLEGPVKRRLLQHLANCLNNSSSPQQTTATQETQATPQPVQVTILRTPDSNIIQGLQLVPTRLPNGDIALILPAARSAPAPSPASPSPSNSSASSASPLPMLIPIPNRSSSESPSPSAFDRLSVNSNSQPTGITTPPSTGRFLQPTMSPPSPVHEDVTDNHSRLVINEDFDPHEPKTVYQDDRETLLHIPERGYYDDSYDDSESEYYQQQDSRPYSPELQAPLALVTRKRYEDNDSREPWRPW